MDGLSRGEVVTVAGGGAYTGKPRPAVVVQSDMFNEAHASVTVVPISTTLVDAPLFRVPLPAGRGTGLKAQSQAMVDKVTSVPRGCIGSRIGALAAVDMERIDAALRLWVDLP
jgi:mRNA interferase MazF